MSLRMLTLTLGLATALPLTAQAEIEVVGPVPAGQFASAYGVSLDILSLGATAVSAECRDGNGTPLATLPLTGSAQGQVTSLQFQTPFGFGTRVSCEAEGTGDNGLINIELNVLGWTGDPQVTLEGRNLAAVPGPEGPQGPTGPQGERGPAGADSNVPGPAGNDGEDGTSCTVAENIGGATISCTDGTSATVDDGEQGPEGPQGPTGPTGPSAIDLTLICGDDTPEVCAARVAPSVVERLEAVEANNVVLQEQLCELADQTGSILPICGPLDGDLRLVDGATSSEGRLELFWQGQWGTVCDDRWDINDATVACRQLGYPGADAALFTFNVVDGTGPILLDDVQCAGTEAQLLDCVHREPVGSHNCSHFEDAGVRCTSLP